MYQTSSSRESHKLRNFFIFIFIIGFAAASYGAYTWASTGPQALETAITSLDDAEKIHTELLISIETDNEELSDASASFISDSDKGIPGAMRNRTVITLKSPKFSATGEIRVADEIIYGKIIKLPEALPIDISGVAGKWYSVSLDSVRSLGKMSGVDSSAFDTQASSFEFMYAMIKATGLLEDLRFSGVGIEQGRPVKKYSILIDKEKFARLAMSAKQSSGASNAYVEQFSAELNEQLDSVQFSPIKISLDLVTGSFRNISASITLLPGKSPSLPKEEVTIHFDLAYDDMREDIAISAPADAVSLDSYLSNPFQSAMSAGKTANIQTSLSRAIVAMEKYYTRSNSYTGGCRSSGDMASIIRDIRTTGVEATCRDSAQAYVLYAPILSPSSVAPSHYCVDSTGKAIIVPYIPSGFACE